MKNVIIYNQINTTNHGASRWSNDILFSYLKAQIDNSLRLGWNINDIIIGTNFKFEYKGIESYILHDICSWSGFNNFWYGALELVRKGVINENFWLHDHDSWQIHAMEFPNFNGDIAGVEYVGTNEWNCGSIFFNKNCLATLQYIVDTLEENKHVHVSSDEVIIGFLRRNSPISTKMISINQRWNVGLTYGRLRKLSAYKPIIVLSFKPDQKDIYTKLEQNELNDLLSSDFLTILNNNFNHESN